MAQRISIQYFIEFRDLGQVFPDHRNAGSDVQSGFACLIQHAEQETEIAFPACEAVMILFCPVESQVDQLYTGFPDVPHQLRQFLITPESKPVHLQELRRRCLILPAEAQERRKIRRIHAVTDIITAMKIRACFFHFPDDPAA